MSAECEKEPKKLSCCRYEIVAASTVKYRTATRTTAENPSEIHNHLFWFLSIDTTLLLEVWPIH